MLMALPLPEKSQSSKQIKTRGPLVWDGDSDLLVHVIFLEISLSELV